MLRIFNVFSGVITIVLAILSLIFIYKDLQTLIIILVTALIIIGGFRVLNGSFQRYIKWYERILKISVGMLVLPIAIVILTLANIVPERIISLLTIVLILNNISRVTIGSILEEYPNWYKVLTIIIGILTIITAVIVLLF